MTPFEAKGWKATDKFVVKRSRGCKFNDGDVIFLRRDDGDSYPLFERESDGVRSVCDIDRLLRIDPQDKFYFEFVEPQWNGESSEPENAGGWIPWGGGTCPVKRGVLVDVKYRDGEELTSLPANEIADHSRGASVCFWQNHGFPNDIVAYRISKTEWNGEGLPPVGTVCERSFNGNQWFITTIVAHVTPSIKEHQAAFCDNDGDYNGWGYAGSFRPIRTEREKAIDEMMKVVKNGLPSKELVSLLYDAGYRKQ